MSTQPNPANAASSRIASASRPLFATTTVCPRFSSRRLATNWLTRLSSTRRMRPVWRASRREWRVTSAGRPSADSATQRQQDRAAQVRALDGFGEVGGDAQLPAPGGITRLAGRREHHDGGAGDGRILLDGLCQGKAIRIGHLDSPLSTSGKACPDSCAARSAASASGTLAASVGDHAPADEHLFEQSPVRGVVVDDEDGQVSQIDRVTRYRDGGGSFHQPRSSR